MSEQIFDRLIYTDCRPGEGLGGGGGYQIQAQSTSCGAAQARMAVGWLLYSVQTRWVNEGRATADFPLGMAHTAASGYGTAQSRYLGKEVNGNRQGNYLADCLLTDDAQSYGVIRPAQLWLAPFWRQESWPTTSCPVFDDGLDLGPFDHDALAEWVKASPDRSIGLARLLTVLAEPDGQRVVIRAATPEAALYWIAASTILLPIDRAVEISFRVFTNSIDDAPHRVVAVPTELYPNLVPGSRPRTFVIDAASDQTDVVDASDSASFWVRQLLQAAEPYDVVEAVEMTAIFGGTTHEQLSDARVAAMAVCDPDRPIEDVAGLGRWVRRALSAEHANVARSLMARLIEDENVRLVDLRLLDQLSAEGQIPVDPEETRARLLAAEVVEASQEIAPPPELLSPLRLTRVRRAEADSTLVSAMILGSDIAVDCLLQVAWRHGRSLEKPSPALIMRLNDFVAHWLNTPGAQFSPSRWVLRDLLSDDVHEQLHSMFDGGQQDSLWEILPRAVELLSGRGIDVTDAFTWEIEGCHMASLDSEARLIRARQTVAQLVRFAKPPQFLAYQQGLVDWKAVDSATAFHLVLSTSYPRNQVHAGVIKVAIDELVVQAEHPGTKTLDVVERLTKQNALQNEPRLLRLAESAAALNTMVQNIDRLRVESDLSAIAPELLSIRDLDSGVVNVYTDKFASAAVRSQGPELGQSILRNLREGNSLTFARTWGDYLSDPGRSSVAAAWSVVWLGDKKIHTSTRRALEERLVQHHASLTEPGINQWWASVEGLLRTDGQRALWEQITRAEAAGRHRASRLWGKG